MHLTLAVLVASSLLAMATGAAGAQAVPRVAVVILCLLALPAAPIRDRMLFAAATALTLWLSRSPEGWEAARGALDLAAFFAAFIAVITVMKEAAARSTSVRSVGRFITAQPEARRYYGTAIGGHILGVFLNFGAVSLMTPLIQSGATDDDGRLDPAMERRQVSALLRGFSWILLWAPTTLTHAVMLTLFPEVEPLRFLAAGIAISVLMILIGRMLDRWEWRDAARCDAPPPPLPLKALFAVLGICSGLIVASYALQFLAGLSTARALMFVAPVVTLAWFMGRSPHPHGAAMLGDRLREIGPVLGAAAPGLARSAVALALAGFIGRAAAAAIPGESIGQWLDLATMPGWLFLSLLPVIITLGGQIALSPIMVVVFLGEILNAAPALPVGDLWIALSLCAGWALSMSASPYATATLLISATSGIAPTTLTWRWNGVYALACYTTLVILFAVLA